MKTETTLSPSVLTNQPTVSCDGDVRTSLHPRVYLDVSKSGEVVCPYCSRRFVLKTASSH